MGDDALALRVLSRASAIILSLAVLAAACERGPARPVPNALGTPTAGVARLRLAIARCSTAQRRAGSTTLDAATEGEAPAVAASSALPAVRKGPSQRVEPMPPFAVPDRCLAITIRAFREHIAPLRGMLSRLFVDPNFRQSNRVRYLALEGAQRSRRRFPERLLGEWTSRRASSPVMQAVQAGGVRHIVQTAPLPPAVAKELAGALRRQFAVFPETQGLRFRSSSNVEDLMGFNGAGLYA